MSAHLTRPLFQPSRYQFCAYHSVADGDASEESTTTQPKWRLRGGEWQAANEAANATAKPNCIVPGPNGDEADDEATSGQEITLCAGEAPISFMHEYSPPTLTPTNLSTALTLIVPV